MSGKVMAVVNGAVMTLDLREAIQREMFLGSYEQTETEWFMRCIAAGDTFIDVGANFGHYTALGSMLIGGTGKIFAFEPSPLASQAIEDMIKASDIRNIVLTKAAVGKSNGTVNLFLPNTPHLHSPSIMPSDVDFVPVRVPVVSLDSFAPLTGVGKIKLVKIDVEGYEPDVLDGMQSMIEAKRVENIFCEFNSGWLQLNSTTPEQLLERFLDAGYEIKEKTQLQKGLPGHNGTLFDLQDIWFSLRGK